MMRALVATALLLLACQPSKKKGVPDASVAAADAGFDYGALARPIQTLRSQLKTTPCDKQRALELGDALNRARDFHGADAWVGEFEQACGRWPRLLWVRQHACEERGDDDCAAKTASALIESRASDSDYWWWRGQAEAKLAHWERARADFLQSMANKPTGFPAYRLAQFADQKLQRPCDGALLIQWWIDHGRRTNEEWIDESRSSLWLAGACARNSGRGSTLVTAAPNAPLVRAAVKLGKTPARFLLDEHAGTSVVSRSLAEKLGLAPGETQVEGLALGSVRSGPLVQVDALGLGAATAKDVQLMVVDGLPEDVDGVVGLNVLMQFQVKRTPKGYALTPLP
jgi:hypothetical protein